MSWTWNGKEVLECLSYGKLYIIAKKTDKRLFLKRVRKNKGDIYMTDEARWMDMDNALKTDPSIFDLIFISHDHMVSLLRPQGDLKDAIGRILR